MKFTPLPVHQAGLIELAPFHDARGEFTRTFCAREFAQFGLRHDIVQSNLSITRPCHTLRGMHRQINGAEEDKIVQCLKGRVWDVILDVRPDSPTFGCHVGVELSDGVRQAVYVPRGCAHGFLTLVDDCHVFYQVTNFYCPEKERGIRWNDPRFKIPWPVKEPFLSDKDQNYPDYEA